MNRKDHSDDKPVGRRPGANNLPGSLAKKDDCWKAPLGLVAVILGNEYDTERAGGTERLVSDPAKAQLGCRSRERWQHVCRLLPDLEAHVRSYGKETEPHELFANRVYYCYRKHKKGGGMDAVVSSEHPMNSKRRRPYWSLARRIYRENVPWTKAQIESACAEIREAA